MTGHDPAVAQHELEANEIRVFADTPIWSVPSMFGSIFTARHQIDVLEHTADWHRHFDPIPAYDRDEALVRAGRRWTGTPLRPPTSGRFLPGDIAAIRYAVARDDLRNIFVDNQDPDATNSAGQATHLAGIAMRAVYAAIPYYVDLATLVGLVDCQLPDGDDLDDLRLPHHAVGIYFGGDIAVPMQLIEADDSLTQLDRRYAAAIADNTDWISADAAPPHRLPGPLIAIARRQPVRICGVILHADNDGRLDDIVMWLTAVPDQLKAPRRIIYGRLSRATLRYVVINLAAAVAWGQWTPPSNPLTLPTDPTSRDFRDATRTGNFRRREPHGHALDVRVLDIKRTISQQHQHEPNGTHASPITHRRKRHWQRYRLGPRDNWHYERRLIDPIIVNPGHKTSPALTIYRLPPPPPTAPNQPYAAPRQLEPDHWAVDPIDDNT